MEILTNAVSYGSIRGQIGEAAENFNSRVNESIDKRFRNFNGVRKPANFRIQDAAPNSVVKLSEVKSSEPVKAEKEVAKPSKKTTVKAESTVDLGTTGSEG